MKQDETLHIKNFIESINRADNSRQKEMKFDIETIKRVRNSLNMLLLRLVDKQIKTTNQVQEIELNGGDFK
jgi:hypothetical protein|tara:strand:- start:70 stop:282 length:213 start_codon:yes stop_codon:yes gene_type:complete